LLQELDHALLGVVNVVLPTTLDKNKFMQTFDLRPRF